MFVWIKKTQKKLHSPHTQTVLQAETEKLFQNVSLCDNQMIVKINVGQFFRSMAENMRSRTATTTSSHVSTQESSSHRGGSKLMSDFKVLQPDTWPEGNLDIQHGEAEVLRLCDTFKIERRESIQGFREYKELRASRTPAALKPLLKAVHTIAVSTSECERAFSCMNDNSYSQKELPCCKQTVQPGVPEMQWTTITAV